MRGTYAARVMFSPEDHETHYPEPHYPESVSTGLPRQIGPNRGGRAGDAGGDKPQARRCYP